jgi:hypothetical protein
MDHGLADMEFVGDLVLRSTISDGGDDGSAASGLPITLLMAASGEGCGFFSPDYSGLIGRWWHKTDREVVALGLLTRSSRPFFGVSRLSLSG